MATLPRLDESYLAENPAGRWVPSEEWRRERVRRDAIDALKSYASAGDGGKLLPVLERMHQICREDVAMISARRRGNGKSDKGIRLIPLSHVVREHVIEVYRAMGCNKTRAARILDIDIKTLYNRLKRYGVQ